MNAHALSDDYRPQPGDRPIALIVDGQVFTLHMRPDGGADYDWKSGPNDGYGVGGGPVRTVGEPHAKYLKTIAEHRTSISDFLSNINPETGYLD